jgi:hypothetical protein
MRILLGALAILTIWSGAGEEAWADLAVPFPYSLFPQKNAFSRIRPGPIPKYNIMGLDIEIAEGARVARLLVPRQRLNILEIQGTFAKALPNEGNSKTITPPRFAVIAAGAALTLGLTLGGLWLVRYRGHFTGRGLLVLITVVSLTGVGSATLWANAPPPTRFVRDLTPVDFQFIPGNKFAGKVVVETLEEGDRLKLILNRSLFAKLLEGIDPKRPEKPNR